MARTWFTVTALALALGLILSGGVWLGLALLAVGCGLALTLDTPKEPRNG